MDINYLAFEAKINAATSMVEKIGIIDSVSSPRIIEEAAKRMPKLVDDITDFVMHPEKYSKEEVELAKFIRDCEKRS